MTPVDSVDNSGELPPLPTGAAATMMFTYIQLPKCKVVGFSLLNLGDFSMLKLI